MFPNFTQQSHKRNDITKDLRWQFLLLWQQIQPLVTEFFQHQMTRQFAYKVNQLLLDLAVQGSSSANSVFHSPENYMSLQQYKPLKQILFKMEAQFAGFDEISNYVDNCLVRFLPRIGGVFGDHMSCIKRCQNIKSGLGNCNSNLLENEVNQGMC